MFVLKEPICNLCQVCRFADAIHADKDNDIRLCSGLGLFNFSKDVDGAFGSKNAFQCLSKGRNHSRGDSSETLKFLSFQIESDGITQPTENE